MAERIELPPLAEAAPEAPPRGPWRWARENLFSTPGSAVLTVVSGVLVIAAIRGLLGFIFDAERRWDAVTTNMRLLMVQAYPAGENLAIVDAAGDPVSQIHRVWISVGIVAALVALTFAIYHIGGRTSRRQVGGVAMAAGLGSIVVAILGPFSIAGRVGWLILGVIVAAIGYWLRQGEQSKQETIPVLGLMAGLVGAVIVALWVVPVPVPEIVESAESPTGFEQGIAFEGIASSTALPWTVMAVVAFLAYFVGVALRDRFDSQRLRRIIVAAWVGSYPIIVLAILRDPDIDYGSLFGSFIVPAIVFAGVGAVLLLYLAGGVGEVGRALSALVLLAGVVSFFVSAPFLIRWLLLSLALFGLLAPTFGGEGSARNRYVVAWVIWVAVLTYLILLVNAESTVEVPGSFFLGGLLLTFLLAITAIAASFPLGVLLALGRTSTMPIFRLISTVYIEIVRGVPLITWLLVAFLMLPIALPSGIEVGGVMRAIGAITLFSAAYLAENVRGGLQSIPGGQSEAARALGMSTVQMTIFITLPQALRAVIPALVGQVIALFKDTSLVTVVGLFEFLHIARAIIPTQTQPINFLGSIKETLIFAAAIYWIFTFTFSRISLRLEKKLGVGER